jgi:ubiquinone/menaquinone biosynthesis C-methylase UbiE
MVLLAFVLDEIDQKATFLHKVARLLKPGGRVVILEWQPQKQEDGPPLEDRIAMERITDDAQAVGLRISEQRELNDQQYVCVLTAAGK